MCNEHRCKEVDAGDYASQVGEKGTLAKNDRREQKRRRVVRTQLGWEESQKTTLDVEGMET